MLDTEGSVWHYMYIFSQVFTWLVYFLFKYTLGLLQALNFNFLKNKNLPKEMKAIFIKNRTRCSALYEITSEKYTFFQNYTL